MDNPEVLEVNATSETPGLDGTSVMGFRHAELPVHGVQFHPESIATEHGHALLANFLRLCDIEPVLPEMTTSILLLLVKSTASPKHIGVLTVGAKSAVAVLRTSM